MTAPDRPERVDGVTDDTIKTEHAHSGGEHANDHALTDRMAAALNTAAHLCDDCGTGGCNSPSGIYAIDDEATQIIGSREAIAEVCAAVVRPVLDRQAAEITDLREQLRQARADLGRYDHYATQIGAKELDTE